MTRLLVAVLVAGLAIVVPSAAQIGSGKIAFVTQDGLYTVNPDGTGRTLLKSENQGAGFGLFSARWSPDGSRIAFVDLHGVEDWRLMVMNADGSNEHLVAAAASIALSRQPWSPDGSRIAWGPFPASGGDVYTADASGGDVRRLTFDGLTRSPPSWSPTGSTLVYSRRTYDLREAPLFVIGADGSGERRIAAGFNEDPTWSPNGEWIAFIGVGGVALVRPDGGDLHSVAFGGSGCGCYSPTWSPDGSRIAFGTFRQTSRYGYRADVYVVDANGSHLTRLTPPDMTSASAPVWSPDGDRILVQSVGLMTMNPDGRCLMNLASGGRSLSEISSWQPIPNGPPVGPKKCRAVAIEATSTVNGHESAITVVASISNEGTETLTNVRVRIVPRRNDLSLQALRRYRCTPRGVAFVCGIDRIGRGESRSVAIRGTARRVGRDASSRSVPLGALLEVTADGSLLATGREKNAVTFVPFRCVTSDRGGGPIEGTRFRDRICGRRGADAVKPKGGKDYVNSGAGPDSIYSRDKYGDVISCGPGLDRVVADAKDKVARDCERVLRRR